MATGSWQVSSPQESQSTSTWRASLFSPLFLMGLSVVVLFLIQRLAGPGLIALLQPVPLTTTSDYLGLVLAAALALLIHEFGHLAAAIACRFKVLAVSLGPFCFASVRSGWTLRMNLKRLFTGSITAVPQSNHHWRGRMLAVVAAGPAATLVTCLLAAGLLQASLIPYQFVSFFWAFAQISFLIFTLGLLPNSPKSLIQNDAALLFALWRDGREANEIFLYHLVLQLQMSGIPPRAFPSWLIQLLTAFQGRPVFMLLYAQLIAAWAFDRGDHSTGNEWDLKAVALARQANGVNRSTGLANSACFDLVFRKDYAAARLKLSEVPIHKIQSPLFKHRILAARDLAHGCVTRSLAEVAAARAFLPPAFESGGFDVFLLQRLHSSALTTR